MKAQIVGIGARRAGISRETRKPYDGISVYILMQSGDVSGYKTGEIFLSYISDTEIPRKMEVGDLIEIDYGRGAAGDVGWIEKVTVIKRAAIKEVSGDG